MEIIRKIATILALILSHGIGDVGATELFDANAYYEKIDYYAGVKYQSGEEIQVLIDKCDKPEEKAALCRRMLNGLRGKEFQYADESQRLSDKHRLMNNVNYHVRDLFRQFPYSDELLQLGLACSLSIDSSFVPYFLAAFKYSEPARGKKEPETVTRIRDGYYTCLTFMVYNYRLFHEGNNSFDRWRFVWDFSHILPDDDDLRMWITLIKNYVNETDFNNEYWQAALEQINKKYPDVKPMDIEHARKKMALLIEQYKTYYIFNNDRFLYMYAENEEQKHRDTEVITQSAIQNQVVYSIDFPRSQDAETFRKMFVKVVKVSDDWPSHAALCSFIIENHLVHHFKEYPPLQFAQDKQPDALKIAVGWFDLMRKKNKDGHCKETLRICDDVLRRNPKDVNAAALKIAALAIQGNISEAKRAFKSTTQNGMNDEDFFQRLATTILKNSESIHEHK